MTPPSFACTRFAGIRQNTVHGGAREHSPGSDRDQPYGSSSERGSRARGRDADKEAASYRKTAPKRQSRKAPSRTKVAVSADPCASDRHERFDVER